MPPTPASGFDGGAIVEDDGLDNMSDVNRPRAPSRCCLCLPQCCSCRCTYNVPSLRELWARDKRLLRSVILLIVLLNIPQGKYILYPFMIFSTWIHESFHGLAALSVGGKISWLNIYPNGSGLAYTALPVGNLHGLRRVWVAGAGYQGTAIVGGIMLIFRRTPLGARIGTAGLGIAILASCALFVRNVFGLVFLTTMGVVLTAAGWKLPPFWVGELYALLAATTCLNAITSIHTLFFVTEQKIGGVVQSSDAMTMEEFTAVPNRVWALIWLVLAFGMTVLGVLVVVETDEEVGKARRDPEERPFTQGVEAEMT